MKPNGLCKRMKLCSETAIAMLFQGAPDTQSALAYPLRAVWRVDSARHDGSTDFKFLISIPKKRIRHAVDRVTMRRRCREAYRLSRRDYPSLADRSIDIAFIYVADKTRSYHTVARSVNRLLDKVAQSINPTQTDDNIEPSAE